VDKTLQKITTLASSRRGFLAGAGALSAATLIGCGGDAPVTAVPTPPVTPAVTDVDILNFALNLEYLEAEFYLRAATGAGIPAADGGGATVTGGAKVPLTGFYANLANELAQTELVHVRALRSTISSIGGTPVAAPALDFTNAFNSAAFAAGIGNSFNPFAGDVNSFLIGAFVFEDVGVTAYSGAAGLLTSKAVLTAAAGIQAVEAYHAATLRNLIAYNTVATSDQTFLNYANQIIQLRSKLGGGMETVITTGGTKSTSTAAATLGQVSYTPSTIVAADTTNAIAFARSYSQVLHVVYATNPGTLDAKGGFFPAGMNGTIKTPTA
jgi:hypothetical protein